MGKLSEVRRGKVILSARFIKGHRSQLAQKLEPALRGPVEDCPGAVSQGVLLPTDGSPAASAS